MTASVTPPGSVKVPLPQITPLRPQSPLLSLSPNAQSTARSSGDQTLAPIRGQQHAPALMMDELVEEILFRIPPDDPASLLRAALVCKRWGRIVSDPGFRRRFREFHRTPPMLGFFRGHEWFYTFVSTSSSRRPHAALLDSHDPIDARHGRVLLWRRGYDDFGILLAFGNADELMVWDPITGNSSGLPLPPLSERPDIWNAAVLCASTGGACDHLDCGGGHFLVVYVCRSKTGMFACVYSSETAAWSKEISANMCTQPSAPEGNALTTLPSALIGNALYFQCSETVLKYDLAAREMSLIGLPQECMCGRTILRTSEDGRLGLVNISSDGLYLYLWSREVGPDQDVEWAQNKVIKLRKLLPDVTLGSLRMAGFAHGLDVILVGSSKGTFTIDLKSVQARKVDEGVGCIICVPYLSFNTPALGAASAEGSS